MDELTIVYILWFAAFSLSCLLVMLLFLEVCRHPIGEW